MYNTLCIRKYISPGGELNEYHNVQKNVIVARIVGYMRWSSSPFGEGPTQVANRYHIYSIMMGLLDGLVDSRDCKEEV